MKREISNQRPLHKKPFFWLAAAGSVYVLANTEVVPLSGRVRFRLVPGFLDDYFARKYDKELLASLSSRFLPENSPEVQRVVAIGSRLAAVCGMQTLEFHVVQDDTEHNAFVSAGGQVVVYTGLLDAMKDDDMLAVILGHEIGHYIAHHVAERIGYDWVHLAIRNVISDSWPVRYLSAMTMTLPRSRLIETEADYMGLLLMAAACFDINAAHTVWSKLHSLKDVTNESAPVLSGDTGDHSSGSSQAIDGQGVSHLIADNSDVEAGSLFDRYMSTHPTYTNRIRNFAPDSPWLRRAQELREQFGCGCHHDSQPALPSSPSPSASPSPSPSPPSRLPSSSAAPASQVPAQLPCNAQSSPCASQRPQSSGRDSASSDGAAPASGTPHGNDPGTPASSRTAPRLWARTLCVESHPVAWWVYLYRRFVSA